MQIGVPKEVYPGENRVPVSPDIAKKLVGLGASLVVVNLRQQMRLKDVTGW